MRVLWMKMGGLWPPNTGGRLRSFHMLRELCSHHQVTVLTTHRPDEAGGALAAELPGCERVESLPYDAPRHGGWPFLLTLARSWLSRDPVDIRRWRVGAVQRRAREILANGRFDLVIADFLLAVPNVPRTRQVPVVFFAHNVEHQIWRRLAEVERRPLRRLLLELEWRKMRRRERNACLDCELTVAVSDADRDRLAAEAPGARVVSVPTGVDVDYFRPQPRAEVPDSLVFSGSMDWFPNEDAILHFIDAILPRIRRVRPQVSLTVVGRSPGSRLRALAAAAGVRVTGTVEDVRPYVADAALYIVPLRVGGGTRIKIFEALAMGKPVLSTTVGAEGLDVRPGTHLEIADGPDAFAEATLALLADPARRARLGATGRQLVETQYSWASVTRAFEAHLRSALASEPRAVEAFSRPHGADAASG